MADNIEKVRKSFSAQAENFEHSSINVSRQEFLEHTIRCADLKSTDSVLDVACGTCFCGRSIAPHVALMTNLDATTEMLEIGMRESGKSGLTNMLYVVGDAKQLPFLSGSFDMAISRLALHHIPNADKAFHEMVRVVKPGGKVIILDLAATREDLRCDEESLEMIHDPSHVRILSTEELRRLFEEDGLEILREEENRTEMTLESWMDMTKTSSSARIIINKSVQDELDGGRETGLFPYMKNGEIYFKQHMQLVIGQKPGEAQTCRPDPAPGMHGLQDRTVDLHTHSSCSDGSFSPTELVQEAIRAGLSAIALTDHDTVSGISEAMEAGEEAGLEVIPGVELSTEYGDEEVHVVGLFIDPADGPLNEQLQTFRDNRDNRNVKIVERLREEGFDITVEDVYAKNPAAVIARPHIARYLVESGQAGSVKEVFDRYIAQGKPCYVERYKITPMEAVSLIHGAGGLAVLAHPCLYKFSREELIRLVGEMKTAGLDGIEAVYSRNRGSDEEDFTRVAENFDLLISGGTDFHGASKPDLKIGTGKGDLHVPYDLLERMKAYRD